MKNITLILLILIGCNLQAQIIYENEKAPELKFTDWINNARGNAILENKHVILEFWATWCVSCIDAMPHLNQLTQKYSDKIAFVSVNSYDAKTKIEKFLKKTKMESYNALDSDKYLKDTLRVQTIPATFLIDNKGKLRWRGYASNLTEKLIDTFLEKDTITDITKNTMLINEEIILSDNSKEEIKVNLNLERFTYNQMQTFTTSIDYEYQDSFFFEAKALRISKIILEFFTSSVDNFNEWDFEILGEEPKLNFDITVHSKSGGKKDLIINEVIKKLESQFNCKLSILERKRKIWNLTINKELLQPYLSKEQDVNYSSREYDQTTKEGIYKNFSLDELAFILSHTTKEKIIYNSKDRTLYDLQFLIDKDSDIETLNKELKSKHGIHLVEQEKNINIMSLSFY